MTQAETESRILNIESQFASFLANTITMQDLSDAQRRVFIDSIFKNGVCIDATDPLIKQGDSIYGHGFINVNQESFWVGEALRDGPFLKNTAVEDIDIEVKFG